MAKRSLPFPSLDFSQTCLSLRVTNDGAPIIRYQQRSTPLATIGFLEVCEKFRLDRLSLPSLVPRRQSRLVTNSSHLPGHSAMSGPMCDSAC